MLFSSLIFTLAALTGTYANPIEHLTERDIGSACQVGDSQGTCQDVRQNICNPGTYHSNCCPNDASAYVQCCINDPALSGTVGQEVLEKAELAAGEPYAYGGGSCDGPSIAIDGTSSIGYDCSGLVCWAVCQVTHRDLFNEGFRNTGAMYCASEALLGYKKYAYADRASGDAVFFTSSSSCENDCTANQNNIHHVGLVSNDITKFWNAPNTGEVVKESNISDFGTTCAFAIRFA